MQILTTVLHEFVIVTDGRIYICSPLFTLLSKYEGLVVACSAGGFGGFLRSSVYSRYRPGFLKHDSPVHDSPVVIRP